MINKNWNQELKREQFRAKEVPDIKLSLVENDKIIYEMIFTNVTIYRFEFFNGKPHVSFSLNTINSQDYQALISKKYDKYFVETANYWRSCEDLQDHLIELPCQVYTQMCLSNSFKVEGDPTQWKFVFD